MLSTELHPDSVGAPPRAAARPHPGVPTVAAEVPERPSLAPGVRLVGEMQGSGFEDSQWLIQRNGRFIQVSELLYRLAEQIDGTRTIDEIAAQTTEASDWAVTAEDVRHLIRTKLIPLGLIAMAGGRVTPEGERPRSALQVRMRRRVFSPRVIDPLTGLLQILYAPAILIPMLAAIAAAHAWLYFVHGTAASIEAVATMPAFLLALIPIILLSAAFHELGHAAALRYGGGQVRGIGVGLYLYFPMVYTDTTDSYRLGRWARLRTSLGGFYFHLIFALGLILTYLHTGQEFLLVVVLLINLDILYQCLPFVRLDGYWALADLIGVPDFFSQTGAFLRSSLPLPASAGVRLPRLKPWVRRAFAAYLALTIPILTLYFFLLFKVFPTFLTTAWRVFLTLAGDFAHARSNGDLGGVAVAGLQIVLLALPVLGLTYLLATSIRRVAAAAWRWSGSTPWRRPIAALGAVAAMVAAASLWIPQLPAVGANAPEPYGVESFDVDGRTHVRTTVTYPQIPPVGGNHAPVWQNCGFYDEPVPKETAVHSMEHGAVWITYRPDLSGEQVAALRDRAHRQGHILASPFPDLPAPVVASAWGRQLRLESADDPRLDAFVRAFRLGRQAPEPGERCDGGVGEPR